MKLSKTIDYVYENTLTAQELNKNESCFVIYFGYYNQERYVRLFARAFGNENASEAFDLYASLESEFGYEYPIALYARDLFSRKNTNEVLAWSANLLIGLSLLVACLLA